MKMEIVKDYKNDNFHKDEIRKSWFDATLLRIFILATCFKMLLIPTYHSTDFEVHRNWLAITFSLPIKEWYLSNKSQWTLDYPPFFAWFEYFLSQVAVYFDPEMLKIDNLNYTSPNAKLFQRATVMIADIILVYGVIKIGETFCKSRSSYLILSFLSIFNVGLLIVDHIHFQYNGFLLGILLLSITKVAEVDKESSILQGAVWFSMLLNLKHIYIYVAPAYVIWLLRWYCIKGGKFFSRILKLGSIVLIVLILSFGPFVSQLPQVFSRLFPFKRGLVHAYWAANAWALYTGADKFLSVLWKQLGWLQATRTASMTGGLVQEDIFTVLPTPTPIVTFVVTFASMIPALWSLFTKNEAKITPKHFVRCLILCGLSSFMFGWHVHEKAILTAILPLCTLAVVDKQDARVFIILSSAGHTGLLPLLYPTELTPLKLLLSLVYMMLAGIILTHKFHNSLLKKYEWLYVGILPFVTFYESVLHKLIFTDRLPFLPLAFTSMYCAIGVTYCWLLYYYMYLGDRFQNDITMYKKKEENIIKSKKKHYK
ncbi:probable dolichyl pyrophosphate Glc1Man9GlcNAc2 alpha-1,3-glucosyltransferase [Cephus cinctus]|uniref:Alpha-1,3-glucosyltransferase n=1 Tax=Cephus cinctus TaxID=211228 RepID=A0AAJ7BUY8_CEPCN|nr:probable dolichyl pyrophosphate Glc1Man9GlcNAc2 alpha-1,3-glucosyltransferase [Cephus cinctus]